MASKQTYECFVCKSNGFPAVMVYLAGKDAQGRAIRLEDDATTPHVHKSKVPSQQQLVQELKQVAASTTETTDLLLQIKLINTKIDRVIALLEKEQQ